MELVENSRHPDHQRVLGKLQTLKDDDDDDDGDDDDEVGDDDDDDNADADDCDYAHGLMTIIISW
eukprot:4726535-Karenia_brevis.AAC.1